MLLTSWIDSMRRTRQTDRYRRARQRKMVSSLVAVERLEDRTLLSSTMLVESVVAGQAVQVTTGDLVGSGTLADPEIDTIVIKTVDIAPTTGSGIEIDVGGDETGKLVLETLDIQVVKGPA